LPLKEMNTVASNQVHGVERWVWLLDETPLDMVHRAGIGFLMFPAHEALFGREAGLSKFIAFFFAVLLVMKFGLGVGRRFFPASAELKAAWRERRMLGKAYDSYQWRKLMGYGTGLLAFLLWSGRGPGAVLSFAIGCIVAGIIGTIVWRQRRLSLVAPVSAAA
jgi:hypothetical protein